MTNKVDGKMEGPSMPLQQTASTPNLFMRNYNIFLPMNEGHYGEGLASKLTSCLDASIATLQDGISILSDKLSGIFERSKNSSSHAPSITGLEAIKVNNNNKKENNMSVLSNSPISSVSSTPVGSTLSSPVSSRRASVISVESKVAAAAPSQRTFGQFLEQKKETTFGIKDYLQSRYIAFVNSKSLKERIINFFLLGGIGWFFTLPVTNRQDMTTRQQETAFYLQCGKVQSLYNKFAKKPADTFTELSQEFEKLHAMASEMDPSEKHQLFNEVLKKQLGVDVAKSLLEHFAEAELTKDGGFSADNLQKFYWNYKAVIATKQDSGYSEKSKPETIEMVFAQVLRKVLGTNQDKWRIYNELDDAADRGPTSDEIEIYQADYNRQLSTVITTGELSEELADLITREEQNLLHVAFMELQKQAEESHKMEQQIEGFRTEHDTAQKELNALLSKQVTCSYTMLLPLFGKADSVQPPVGFEGFAGLVKDVNAIEKKISEIQAKIEEDKAAVLKEHEIQWKALIEDGKEAKKAVEKATEALEAHRKILEGAEKAAKDAGKKLPLVDIKVGINAAWGTSIEETDIKNDQARLEYNALARDYQEVKKNHEQLKSALAKEVSEMKNTLGKLLNKQAEVEAVMSQVEQAADVELKYQLKLLKIAQEATIPVTGASINAIKAQVENIPELQAIVTSIEEKEQAIEENRSLSNDIEQELQKSLRFQEFYTKRLETNGFNVKTMTSKHPAFAMETFIARARGEIGQVKTVAAQLWERDIAVTSDDTEKSKAERKALGRLLQERVIDMADLEIVRDEE